jgi:hypothetical protein
MDRKLLPSELASNARLLRHALTFIALLIPSAAWSTCINQPGKCNCQDIDLTCPTTGQAATFGATGAVTVQPIALCPLPATTKKVYWSLNSVFNCAVSADPKIMSCGGLTVTAPAEPNTPADASSKITFTGTPPTSGIFKVTATDVDNPAVTCSPTYSFSSSAGGWGDPHLTTVDGAHYNFQGAGEFVALRGPGLEIQTRQTPVATTSLPGADAYDNVRTCVSIYSAVAAQRVGGRRVTYEPNISGVPDPSGMQLRVDGAETSLGHQGVDIGLGDRLVKPSGADGIEIDYADGTVLSVTPAYWADQQQWYLNLTVGQTTAHEGIFGAIASNASSPGIPGAVKHAPHATAAAAGGWLPALPDGTSLGPMPDSLHQRYVDLYETFANAWRVTDATSLFDYGPGQSTGSFNLAGWPRENPTSCAVPKKPLAQPVDVGVAEAQCKGIFDKNNRADCAFDVMVTGNLGFATIYKTTQERQFGATETKLKGDPDVSAPGENVAFTATVSRRGAKSGAGAPAGTVQFIVDGAKIGGSATLDAAGRAHWSTSSLAVGQHRIAADYTPAGAGWGGMLLASDSPEERHIVVDANGMPLWLIVLLVILLLGIAIWWFVIKK